MVYSGYCTQSLQTGRNKHHIHDGSMLRVQKMYAVPPNWPELTSHARCNFGTGNPFCWTCASPCWICMCTGRTYFSIITSSTLKHTPVSQNLGVTHSSCSSQHQTSVVSWCNTALSNKKSHPCERDGAPPNPRFSVFYLPPM